MVIRKYFFFFISVERLFVYIEVNARMSKAFEQEFQNLMDILLNIDILL